MRPELKAPGNHLLTLKHDESLSTFAFKLNLRRYSTDPLFGDTRLWLQIQRDAAG